MTTAESLLQLSIGILIHKSVASISLGASLANSGLYPVQNFIIMFIFAMIAPIGVGIGMSIHDASPITDAIFLSISGGTFIYVACTEIIVHEFDMPDHGRCMKFGKSIMVLLGGLLITCLWFIDSDDH